MADEAAIGFPPPLLGDKPWRLKVVGSDGGWLALNKPQGITVDTGKWVEQGTPLLEDALEKQARAGKPELIPYGIEKVKAVYTLDPEIGGVQLFAVKQDSLEALRNAYGSRLLIFCFNLLCEADTGPDERVCELPVAPHFTEKRAVISHKTGRKITTRFRLISRAGKWAYWEAETDFLRPHHLRIHASEVGLRVVGETLYNQVPSIKLSDLKRNYRPEGEERPIHEGLALFLRTLKPRTSAVNLPVLEAEPPSSMAVLFKKLGGWK